MYFKKMPICVYSQTKNCQSHYNSEPAKQTSQAGAVPEILVPIVIVVIVVVFVVGVIIWRRRFVLCNVEQV